MSSTDTVPLSCAVLEVSSPLYPTRLPMGLRTEPDRGLGSKSCLGAGPHRQEAPLLTPSPGPAPSENRGA